VTKPRVRTSPPPEPCQAARNAAEIGRGLVDMFPSLSFRRRRMGEGTFALSCRKKPTAHHLYCSVEYPGGVGGKWLEGHPF